MSGADDVGDDVGDGIGGGADGQPAAPRLGSATDGGDPGAMLAALLAALRSGRDAGAGALWSALTPRARGPLGDVDGARRALGNELLAPLVAHTSAAVEPWELRGDIARTHLRVVGDSARAPAGQDTVALYLVSARRDAAGAWRLTGLRRDDLPWG